MNRIPYAYYIHHLPTGKKYYGIRYGANCHPDDLWTSYFTSSESVRELIDIYGADSFEVKIRKTFETAPEAVRHEHTVLRRLNAMDREDWLNETNGWNGYNFERQKHRSQPKTTEEHGRSGFYKLTSKEGNITYICNLKKFCRERNFSAAKFFEVQVGNRKSYRGTR